MPSRVIMDLRMPARHDVGSQLTIPRRWASSLTGTGPMGETQVVARTAVTLSISMPAPTRRLLATPAAGPSGADPELPERGRAGGGIRAPGGPGQDGATASRALNAVDVEPPRGSLHQGAVFAGVPLLWYTDVALALRPKEGHDYRQLLAHRASDDPRAFQDEHLTVAWARRSRVLVISPHQELHRQAIRILAVHGYEEERGLSRARSRLERGEVP